MSTPPMVNRKYEEPRVATPHDPEWIHNGQDFTYQFQRMAAQVHETAIAKGFWDPPNEEQLSAAFQKVVNRLTEIPINFDANAIKVAADTLGQAGLGGAPTDAEKIALMHQELSEALEALRKPELEHDHHCPKFYNVEIEMADLVIRVMDWCEARGLRLSEAIVAKAKFNTTRPPKHGKKF